MEYKQRPSELSQDPKHVRARMRRAEAQMRKIKDPKKRKARAIKLAAELDLYYKPVEEWDMEELARGRPRSKNGTFDGAPPKWIDRRIIEESERRFKRLLKRDMYSVSVDALAMVAQLIARGRSEHVRLQAAQFIIEHVLGKPKQEITQDLSVKLQSILASAMVNPDDVPAYGYDLEAEVVEDDDEDEEETA